jgi:fucose permease
MFSFLLLIIYVCFISLGLPDSLLGSSWPTIYKDFNVPVSYAGFVSVTIALGTIVSSLASDKITKKLSPGLVTAISIIMTAGALLGFSLSNKFWMLIIFAIPYGLGAGGVDACLNNYVALHYESKHMSWLHCMWGIGATISPYIMGFVLTNGNNWNNGYLIVSIIQFSLAVFVFTTLPKWEKRKINNEDVMVAESLSIKQIISIPGAITCFILFFCYCALEQTSMLWASSYLVLNNGMEEEIAAMLGSLFCIGITLGRAINGFLAMMFNDKFLIRLGLGIIFGGIILLFIPVNVTSIIGFILIGLGCAPVYPCIIHSTPNLFGKEKSQAMIGVQMACAYLGTLIMPPLFGLIANQITISLLPVYLILILFLAILMNEITNKKTRVVK